MAVINENYMEMKEKNLESRNIQPKNSELPIPNEQDNLIAETEEGNRKNKNEQKLWYLIISRHKLCRFTSKLYRYNHMSNI